MKIAFLSIASFVSTLALAQMNVMDTLQKYSYYVFGNKELPDGLSMQTVEGTCFFVKAGDKTFLVSAKHVMTSWSTSDASKPDLYPDTLFVRFPLSDTGRFIDYPIDIRNIKAHAEGSYYYNEPDIFVMEFPETDKIQINAIDEIMPDDSAKGLLASAVVYGFPPQKNKKIKMGAYLEARLFSSPYENITYRDNKRNVPVSDTINYLIKCTTDVQAGYSGAPVFLKNDDSDQWHFAGIVSQGVPGDNYFFVVKPVWLQQKIKGEL